MSELTRGDIDDQRSWSLRTFGPGRRTNGLIAHIKKELAEIDADPTDLEEWIDLIVLALDGAWRAGYTAPEIIGMYHSKMQKNFNRDWPDWRLFSEDEAIEHVR